MVLRIKNTLKKNHRIAKQEPEESCNGLCIIPEVADSLKAIALNTLKVIIDWTYSFKVNWLKSFF